MKVEVLPERIVAQAGVEHAGRLLVPTSMQIGVGTERTALLHGGGYVILDFGKEIVGGVRLLSHFSEEGIPVRLRFGESVAETCSDIGEKNATNDHALRDFRMTVPQLSDGVYGNTGFRFLRIDSEGELSLKAAVAVDTRCDFPVVGSFSCNDGRVNEIYATARETLLCCVQNGYVWDGVKRDRLVWIGDLHPEMLGLFCTTGNIENIANCIRIAAAQTPLPGWINGIPAYSLWWIVNLHDLYAYTGDISLAKEMGGYFTELMSLLEEYVGEDGSTTFPYDFLDWPTHGQEDELAGQAGLLAIAMRKAEALSRALNVETPASRILARVLRRKDGVRRSKQAEAMRALAGLAERGETKRLLEEGGCRGISTFMSYYILRALAETGAGEQALSFMKEYYGGMLDVGARTFWEDFSPDWREGSGRIDELPKAGERDIHGDFGAFCYVGFRHSLCHGWSCGPIPFLNRVVLGVRVVEAGCTKLAIEPDLCGLERVEGDFPTPMGRVHIIHERKAGGIETHVEAPGGVEIVKGGKSLLA